MLITAALAACGGGGGDEVTVDPNVPGKPTLVTAVAGDSQATVTFSAPASTGGGAITGYTVKALPSGGVDSQAGSTALTHVVTGLTNGKVYIFTVTATNSFGTSLPSTSSNSVQPNTPTVPGAPTIGAATVGDGQALVGFTAPTTSGSAAITSYTATCGTVSGTGTASPVAVTNLINGTAYTCTVFATNSAGNSVASAASNSVTPAPAPPVGALNDTGQLVCYNGVSFALCDTSNSGNASTRPRQDGRIGRDAMAGTGQLSKRGGGPVGFDFTKMCMSGQLAGTGTCALTPPTPASQAAATTDQWALHQGQPHRARVVDADFHRYLGQRHRHAARRRQRRHALRLQRWLAPAHAARTALHPLQRRLRPGGCRGLLHGRVADAVRAVLEQ